MRILDDADARDLAALLESLSRATRHVLLEADRVPNLDGAVIRACREEELIRSDLNVGDGASVLDEVGDERSFRSTRRALPRREAGTKSATSRDADRHARAELGKWLPIVVEVHSLEQLLDTGIVAICEQKLRSAKCEISSR